MRAPGDDEVYVFVQRGSGRFEVSVNGRLVAMGRANELDEDVAENPPPTAPREERCVSHTTDPEMRDLPIASATPIG